MGILDSILRFVKLSDEDEDEEEEYEEEELDEEEEEEKPRRSFMNFGHKNSSRDDDDDDDEDFDDDDDEEDDEAPRRSFSRKSEPSRSASAADRKSAFTTSRTINNQKPEDKTAKAAKSSRPHSKVVPLKANAPKNMEVTMVKPTSFEDAREIADILLSGRAVVINLEGLHIEIAQRIMDFAYGTCYSMDGNLQKISNYVYIVVPASIELSGDFNELLGNTNFIIK